MAYTHVLLDLDHTLFDTDFSLESAFDDAMRVAGVEPDGHYPIFDAINRALWQSVERGELTPPQVHIKRFVQFIATLELEADPHAMAEAFGQGLGARGDLYPGARELLEDLAGTVALALVTNGLSSVQRTRIERLGLGAYFEAVIISAEVGVSKPNTAIFDLTFAALDDPPRPATLMVGDSLSSDIAGGNNYGISTCWYNPHARPAEPDQPVTYTIATLDELPGLVHR